MTRLKRSARGAGTGLGVLLAWGAATHLARTDSGPGYLAATNVPVPAIRLVAPPLPPVAPLPPLPPTYVPTPKYSAEFMAELRATSALMRSNFVVQASTESDRPGRASAPGPDVPAQALVTVPVAVPQQLMSHFLSGNPATNAAFVRPLLFHLPVPVETGGVPPAGTSRSTYEVR